MRFAFPTERTIAQLRGMTYSDHALILSEILVEYVMQNGAELRYLFVLTERTFYAFHTYVYRMHQKVSPPLQIIYVNISNTKYGRKPCSCIIF